MTRFALTLEFDGTPFQGLQRQKNGPSVQQAVESAIFAVTGENAALHAAGRTDAGVHALAMTAHVDIARRIAPFRLMEALNALLRPAPIAVLACETKPDDWHARFSCLERRYLYRVANRRQPLTLEKDRAWHVGGGLHRLRKTKRSGRQSMKMFVIAGRLIRQIAGQRRTASDNFAKVRAVGGLVAGLIGGDDLQCFDRMALGTALVGIEAV